MTAKPAEIYSALMARVDAMVIGSPALPVVKPEPETVFEPPGEGGWIEVADFTNVLAWEGLASGRVDQGILLVTVCWEKNRGLEPLKLAAGEVMAHFAKGTEMTSGATTVVVTREPYAASPIVEEDQVRIPVTVYWRA